jgi:hypothetical protein
MVILLFFQQLHQQVVVMDQQDQDQELELQQTAEVQEVGVEVVLLIQVLLQVEQEIHHQLVHHKEIQEEQLQFQQVHQLLEAQAEVEQVE